MIVSEVLFNIFEIPQFQEISTNISDKEKPRLQDVINLVEKYIDNAVANSSQVNDVEDHRTGRIGPDIVKFDATRHGLFIVSPDGLTLNGQSNFSTARANVAVYSGKWMYEVQLASIGVMQIGWSTIDCKFNQESGVGDTINSYAYDGNRIRKWNVSTYKYGEKWSSGDIIGCTIDLDEAKINFYRNGRDLGIAFDNITTGPGMAYFPTVSLAFTENLIGNFGDTPMRYPVPGYNPLRKLSVSKIHTAFTLFNWFEKLLQYYRQADSIERDFEFKQTLSAKTFITCVAKCILKHIGPLICEPDIVVQVFVPFFKKICKFDNLTIVNCLNLMWMFLDETEMKSCLEATVNYLSSGFRQVSLHIDYAEHCSALMLLNGLCEHKRTRQYLLQFILFQKMKFPVFLQTKPVDEICFNQLISNPWWETDPVDQTVEIYKDQYIDACNKIKASVSEVEALQIELLIKLMNNTDGSSKTPTSRAIFLRKFRQLVHENITANRVPLPMALCSIDRLLVTFKILWDSEVATKSIYVPTRMFCDVNVNYGSLDRLGGDYSYLRKVYRSDLANLLGCDDEGELEQRTAQPQRNNNLIAIGIDDSIVESSITRMMTINSVNEGISNILQRIGYLPPDRDETTPLRLGPLDSSLSLLELLDGITLFYNVAGKKHVLKVAGHRDNMTEYVSALTNLKSKLEKLKGNTDDESESIKKQLKLAIEVFEKKLAEQAKTMAWIRAVVFSSERQTRLAWLLEVVILSLKHATLDGNLFSFVPEFYLDVLTDLTNGLKNHIHPTVPIERISNFDEILEDIAEFLCEHYMDPRIISANSKDSLVLMLAGFASFPAMLKALENTPVSSRVKMVSNLLKPYENRAWAQANWILVRFWQGDGFAFRYEKSPHLAKKFGPKMLNQNTASSSIKPCPSKVFQAHVKEILLNDHQKTVMFMNSLLNQLNWAFSEFVGTLQEIHNISCRPERIYIESRQLKICATCFDLTIFLLRVLEMIASIAPSIFNDPSQVSSDNLLSRLCQLICLILNRVSWQSSSFQHILMLDIPDLQIVDHFPILAAVIGILIALLKEEMCNDNLSVEEIPRLTNALLNEPSFQMTSLLYILGENTDREEQNVANFSFLNYKGDVSEAEIDNIKKLIDHLEFYKKKLPATEASYNDEDLCTICYASPASIIFRPCNHHSCRACIERHILSNKNCFFCKTKILQIVTSDGTIVNDLTSSTSSDTESVMDSED